ncbi:MAG: rhomboid family intramembrane serine protease [Candidatus Eremiobacteraeota bacterium]|nr:rhomboid family intramembrane serine protease [Candidatus Eremiobacteraeota bacterium]
MTEFFDMVLVSGNEPRMCLFKQCDNLTTENIEEILPFGRELLEEEWVRKRRARKTALVILIYKNGISPDVARKILQNKSFKNTKHYNPLIKTIYYNPLIIDGKNEKIFYNPRSCPISLLEEIFFIKSTLFGKKSKEPVKELSHSEEIDIIKGIEDFRLTISGSKAYIIWLIILINIAVWLMVKYFGNPGDPETLIQYGAKVNPLIWRGEFWRLLTPVFLHVNLAHLFSNCIILYFVGSLLEATIGRWRLLIIYLFSGITGNLLSLKFSPFLSAGASSAVFGILGAAIIYGITYKKLIPRNFYRIVVLCLVPFLIYNFAVGYFHGRIDNYAHIGGLLGGIFISYLLGVEFPRGISKKPRWGYAIALTVAFSLYYMYCMQSYPRAYAVYYSVQAGIKARKGEFADAASLLKQSVDIDPNRDNTRAFMGRIYYEMGNKRFNKAKFEPALYYFKKAAEYMPLNDKYRGILAMAQERIAYCYATRGKDLESIKHYQYALCLNPDNEFLKRILSNEYRIMGSRILLQGDCREAIGYIKKAIFYDNKNIQARILLGEAYFLNGRIPLAAEVWKSALKIDPGNVVIKKLIESRIFQSFWYMSNVDYNPPGISPEARALNREGERIITITGDYEKAQEKFLKAYKIAPNYPAPLNNLARIDLMFNDIEEAKKKTKRSLEIDPSFHEALNNQAILYVEANKSQKAREILDKCIKLKPGYASCYGVLGTINHREGNYREAEKYLKKALSLESYNVPLRIEMAKVYYDMNDVENFRFEANNCLGYAHAQGRDALTLLIRNLLKGESGKGEKKE